LNNFIINIFLLGCGVKMSKNTDIFAKEKIRHSKYGILNVGKNTNKAVITGFVWSYRYFDGEKLRVITSYDLLKLRKKVESIGEEWVIVDLDRARKAYELNRKAMKIHEDYIKNKKTKS